MGKGNFNFTPGGAPAGDAAQPQQLNVDVMSLPNIRCPNCANQVYQPLYVVKKISSLQSPTGKDSVIPLQILACTSCGAVSKEMGGSLLEPDQPTEQTSEEKTNDEQ